MRKTYYTYLLLGNTILSGTMLNLSTAQAACVSTPDCDSLGYTETSCPDGELRCPWNPSKLFCTCTGYDYTCTGSNEAGGSGTACDGKYTACACASGYAWNGSGCTKICVVGDILNSDMTCTTEKVSGKTPIGVVSYVNGSKRIAINLDQTRLGWGGYGTDISRLTNYTDSSTASNDFNGKSNTWKIVSALGTGTNYAAGYCNAYSKGGVSGWYLPAPGELHASIYKNYSTVNSGISAAGGTTLSSSYYYWSSSESSGAHAWTVTANVGFVGGSFKYLTQYVRCILAF